ncbi:MAG: protein O-GlcNAcase [Protaetiibacter sp.]
MSTGLSLFPPRSGSLDGARVAAPDVTLVERGDAPQPPRDDAGRVRPEGFTIEVSADAVRIGAADAAGERHARALVGELVAAGELRTGIVSDWPEFAERGVIEGFYGAPWTHAERLRLVAELGVLRMNRYVYAPKDDPYHRRRWRESYPEAEAARLAELVAAAHAAGVELVYALHPGLDMVHSDDADHAALGRKARELHELGIRRFALLFDDIDEGLADARDRERYGEGVAGAGRAHGASCTRFEHEVLEPLGIGGQLLMVPTDYAGSDASPYREGLAAALDEGIGVFWTGDDIVVGAVTEDQTRRASRAFGGHPLVLWDNFPVNDFDRSRAFLGPLLGREPELAAAGLAGIVANPMVEFEPSRFAIHAVAAWAWNPHAYDPARAAEAALHAVAGADAERLRPLVAAASSWPPSAPQHPQLAAEVEAAFADGGVIGSRLAAMLDELDALAGLEATTPLRSALGPWADAAPATTAVIRAALAHVHGAGGADAVEAAWEAARTSRHGLARDVARTAAERALGRALPDRIRPEGDPAAAEAAGD